MSRSTDDDPRRQDSISAEAFWSSEYRAMLEIAREFLGTRGFERGLQAEELVHETYLRWSIAPRIPLVAEPRDDFRKCVRSLLREVLIHRTRNRPLPPPRLHSLHEDELEPLPSFRDPEFSIELEDALDEFASHGSRSAAQILRLRAAEGLSLREIGTRCGVGRGTVAGNLRAARAWMRRALGLSEA